MTGQQASKTHTYTAGERSQPRMVVDRTGVTRVERKSLEVYRVAFSYRGAQCREHLVLPHTKANDTYVSRLRAEILGKIARNDFNYAEFFPESSRAGEHGRGSARGVATLGDALDAWILRTKATLEPSTWVAYNNAVTHKLKPFFGKLKPATLRASDIREWVGLQATSLKTISNVLLPLRAVLDELVEDEVIKINLLRAIKIAKMVPVAKRTSEYDPDPFTLDEVARVLRAMAPADVSPFLFWAHTGVRTGELIGLKWQRVDRTAGWDVKIHETTTLGRDKDRPKTKSGIRTFAPSPAARLALERAESMLPFEATHSHDRVFQRATSRAPGNAWGYNTLAAAWKAACLAAGVRYRAPYQLRHTFAVQLLRDGCSHEEVAALLGHKNAEMVIRVYGRVHLAAEVPRLTKWGSL